MSNAGIAAKTGTCQHCGKDIKLHTAGVWGARKRDDPHPWYCDAAPGTGKRHQPSGKAA